MYMIPYSTVSYRLQVSIITPRALFSMAEDLLFGFSASRGASPSYLIRVVVSKRSEMEVLYVPYHCRDFVELRPHGMCENRNGAVANSAIGIMEEAT